MYSCRHSRLTAAVVSGALLLSLGLGGAARAETGDDSNRSAARQLALTGIAALQKGDADKASEKLEKAYRVLQVPSIGLWAARALAKRGLLVEASERYQEISRLGIQQGEKGVQQQARADAARELTELTPRIPVIAIALEGATVEETKVLVDGALVPVALLGESRPLNPGVHRVVGEMGGQQVEHLVKLGEADQQSVTLHFKPVPPVTKVAAPSVKVDAEPASVASSNHAAQKTMSYVALGLGGAGLIAGGITGVLALEQKKTLDNNPHCVNRQCEGDAGSGVDKLNALRTLSTVSFVAGGVLAATGVVLLLTSTRSNDGERAGGTLTIAVGPSSAALMGEF